MRGEGISVSELNQIILTGIRAVPQLRDVMVTAEISGFKHHIASGHWYFSLKDANAAISCVMFRQNNLRAEIRPREGDRITVRGYVELFARDGKVQLYVMSMRAAGTGSLYEQFEALKKKLSDEGLFDPARKRVLPVYPNKVAVITSASGAALHDILNVSGHRSPGIPIVLVPSLVQGPDAAEQIAQALQKAARIPGVDVILLGRGGGSVEDLWCFNEEIVARAVAACPIPVVSGVGHETDTTICDFVADVRASTPSNAAEIVFPDREEMKGRTRLCRTGLVRAIQSQIHRTELIMFSQRERLYRLSPENTLRTLEERGRATRERLMTVMCQRLRDQEQTLSLSGRMIQQAAMQAVTRSDAMIQQMRARLQALSPLKVLERGYALVYDEREKILPDAETARKENEMTIRFRDGMVRVRKEQG